MSDILYYGILGLGPGAMLGLLALGMVVIYRGTGVLNLAHAAQAAIGAYTFDALVRGTSMPPTLALLLAVVCSGLSGVAIEVLVMRRLQNASPLAHLVATTGILIIIQSVLLKIFGSSARNVKSLLPTDPIALWDGRSIGVDRLLLVVVVLVVTALLWGLYRFTVFGIATAAVVENPVAGAALGHNRNILAVGNWFLGSALAGLAGALLAPTSGLDLTIFVGLLVPVLAAALGGGLASFPLTVLAGMAIGVAQSETAAYSSVQGASTIVVFVVLVIVMLLRGRAIPVRGYVGARMPSVGTGRIRWGLLAAVIGVAMVVIWGVASVPWNQAILTSMLIALPMLSVVVVTGYTGQLSLAQFALAGVGAVTVATIAQHYDIPLLVLLVVGGLAAVPFGLVLAVIAMRMRGASLAVITLGFNVLLFATVFSSSELVTIPAPTLFGIDLDPWLDPRRYLTFVVVVFVVIAIGVANIRRSPSGRRLIAVRSNESAAASLGINVKGAKVTAFAVSAFIASVGGVLIAFSSTSVVYTNFDVMSSINQLAWTVIGGLGWIVGPLMGMQFGAGGIGSQLAADIYTDQFTWLPLIGGVFVVLTVLQNPDGVVSVMSAMTKRGRRRQRETLQKEVDADLAKKAEPTDDALGGTEMGEVRASASPGLKVRRGLEIENLSVSFGPVDVLKNISLRVEPGTVHGLIGPNGAGKTTLLDAISGFVTPRSGSIRLGDTAFDGVPTWRRSRAGLGRSFQSLELFTDMSVYDNLRVACESMRSGNLAQDIVRPGNHGLSKAAWDVVELFEMKDLLNYRISELPYGKQHIVAVARALATSSDVLLLDEPAAGLDDTESSELRVLIRRVAEHAGHAVLLIEHNVDLVMSVSDVVTALNVGEVIATGTPAEVRTNPAVIASYLGQAAQEVDVEHDLVEVPELGAH